MAAISDNSVKAGGGCLCGAVRYMILGDLRGIINCHWFKSITDETPNVHRGFCIECGSSLFWHPRDQEKIWVAAGSLDDPTNLQTIGHVWISQISDYYEINDDLPKYEKGWPK